MKTHAEIKNPLHRKMLANELLVIRRVLKDDFNSGFAGGVRAGLETAFRRLENEEYVRSLQDADQI